MRSYRLLQGFFREFAGVIWGLGSRGYFIITPEMGNLMDKNMDNEMETGVTHPKPLILKP